MFWMTRFVMRSGKGTIVKQTAQDRRYFAVDMPFCKVPTMRKANDINPFVHSVP